MNDIERTAKVIEREYHRRGNWTGAATEAAIALVGAGLIHSEKSASLIEAAIAWHYGKIKLWQFHEAAAAYLAAQIPIHNHSFEDRPLFQSPGVCPGCDYDVDNEVGWRRDVIPAPYPEKA